MKKETFLLLFGFLLQANFSLAQTFQITIPHPHENEATGVVQTSSGDYLIATTQGNEPSFNAHLLNNTLKIYKLAEETGQPTDSLEWTAPADFGIAQLVRMAALPGATDVFVCYGSYNEEETSAKNPFILRIDADLNVLDHTVFGQPDRREVFYDFLSLSSGNALCYGCFVSGPQDNCDSLYQIEMTGTGEVITERVLPLFSDSLDSPRLTEMVDTYVLEDYFGKATAYLDKETWEQTAYNGDPYGQANGDTYYIFRGYPHSVVHPLNENLLVTPGEFSWLEPDQNHHLHHGIYIRSQTGELVDSIILQTAEDTQYAHDNFLATSDDNFVILAHPSAGLFLHENYLLQKFQPDGEIIWERRLETANGQLFNIKKTKETLDGGFILVGAVIAENVNSLESFILKLNTDGEIISSVPNFLTVAKAHVYPTLVDTELNIDCTDCTDSRAFLTDLNGKLLQSQKLNADKTTLSLSDLAAGIYFVSLEQNGRIFQTRKVVKK